MKCTVIYFSQTGNTEKIAKSIQKGLRRAAGHCEISRIKDVNPRRLSDYDLIGLGSPVLHFEEPGNVRSFIKDMRFVGGKHAFVFSTHGTHPEYFFPSIVPRMKRRGLIVIAMRDWYGDCPFMPQPYPTTGHPDAIDLKEAEDFGYEVVERSQRISAGERELIPPAPPKPKQTLEQVEAMLRPSNLGKDTIAYGFKDLMEYHAEKCKYPECRLCMEHCPMDGIDLSLKPPVIGKPCISCMFCARICPTGAIDDEAYIKATAGGDPELFRAFFLSPLSLKEAEDKGIFRRLVPEEEVGSRPRMPLHKHPKWVIVKDPKK